VNGRGNEYVDSQGALTMHGQIMAYRRVQEEGEEEVVEAHEKSGIPDSRWQSLTSR